MIQLLHAWWGARGQHGGVSEGSMVGCQRAAWWGVRGQHGGVSEGSMVVCQRAACLRAIVAEGS